MAFNPKAVFEATRDPALMNQPLWWLTMEFLVQAQISVLAKWLYIASHWL